MRPAFIRGRRGSARVSLLMDEQGIALVMAIGIMLVLTIALATVAYLTTSGTQDAQRTNAGQRAYALAESGVNDALAILDQAYAAGPKFPNQDRCLLHDPGAPTTNGLPGIPFYPTISTASCSTGSTTPFSATPNGSRPNETVSYWGALRLEVPGINTAWIIRATGSVPNPSGPLTPAVTRTVTVKVPVTKPTSTPGGSGVLGWIYSGQNTSFNQSVSITSPLYVNGNIDFFNTATVNGPLYANGYVWLHQNGNITGSNCPPTPALPAGEDPGCLNVNGFLEMDNNNSKVGTNSKPISDAFGGVNITGKCIGNGNTSPGNCGSTPPTPAWTAENVFATSHTNTTNPVPFKPMTTSDDANCTNPAYSCLDFGTQYLTASPGPFASCGPSQNPLPSSTFDGDGVHNNSIVNAFDLTPPTPYQCFTPGGFISWDPTKGTNSEGLLSISGTVYIDGSAYIYKNGGNNTFSYSGVGAIWLSGSFGMTGTNMCAVVTNSGNNCDTSSSSGWDPSKAALAIVAEGNGYSNGPSQANVPSGDSFSFGGTATFQGVIAGEHTADTAQTAVVQGPLMSVDNQVTAQNVGGLTFPPLPFAPNSAPGQPPPPAVLLQPTQFGGG